jgi:hypothetical protein
MAAVPSFFLPGASDPQAAWDWYVRSEGLAEGEVEALYEVFYLHGGDRYEVRVGEPRHVFRRETGPRGGYRPNAGHRRWSSNTGTPVTAIMRTPDKILVWSAPPYGQWANPSIIGLGEVEAAVRFAADEISESQ